MEAVGLIEDGELERALLFLERAVEGDQDPLFYLFLESAAKELGLRERAVSFRRLYASAHLREAASALSAPTAWAWERAKRFLDVGDVERALDLVENLAEADPRADVWTSMEMAAQSFGLQERATGYLYRGHGTPEREGPSEEERVIKSTMPVREGMARVIDFYADYEPHPDWERFRELDVEGDLRHLKEWFESVLVLESPGPEITGLWFGLVNPIRGGIPTADMYVRGCTYDAEDEDWIMRTGWYPSVSEAGSGVLDEIYRIAYRRTERQGAPVRTSRRHTTRR